MTYGYDAVGDVTSITDANGNKMTAVYDDMRRVIQKTAPALLLATTTGANLTPQQYINACTSIVCIK